MLFNSNNLTASADDLEWNGKKWSGDFAPVSFAEFEIAYKNLSAKLQPQVFELGFLRA